MLVTGGSGFVGSSIASRFLQIGSSVRILDVASLPERLQRDLNTPSLEFIEGDVRASGVVAQAVRSCATVFHQAAMVSVPESVAHPSRCAEVNVVGTATVLVASQEFGVERMVFASSSAVYGNNSDCPKVESMALEPRSPYAVSKMVGEELCSTFDRAYGLQTIALRYFNVFGPGQSSASPYAAVIPKFIEALTSDTTPIIYGDGEQTRDFVYIDDVIQANICAAEAISVSGEAFNIGSGIQVSLNSLLEITAGILGVAPRAEYRSERAGDVRHSAADISKARTLLGYEPKTSLEDGLRQTIEWYLRSKNA